MSTEIPIDVHSATQDSMKEMQRALVSAYDINNLNVSVFLTAAGKQVQLKSEKVSDRPVINSSISAIKSALPPGTPSH